MKNVPIPEGSEIRVLVPEAVNSIPELIGVIAAGLQFPEWHGKNWNALIDCLCDLSWLPEDVIVIEHDGTPHLEPDELSEYVRVLNDAARFWELQDGKRILVVFHDR